MKKTCGIIVLAFWNYPQNRPKCSENWSYER